VSAAAARRGAGQKHRAATKDALPEGGASPTTRRSYSYRPVEADVRPRRRRKRERPPNIPPRRRRSKLPSWRRRRAATTRPRCAPLGRAGRLSWRFFAHRFGWTRKKAADHARALLRNGWGEMRASKPASDGQLGLTLPDKRESRRSARTISTGAGAARAARPGIDPGHRHHPHHARQPLSPEGGILGAVKYHERARALCEKALGPSAHPKVAQEADKEREVGKATPTGPRASSRGAGALSKRRWPSSLRVLAPTIPTRPPRA